MKGKKTKRLYYRRATWAEQGKDSLQELLTACHDLLPTTGQRTYPTVSGEVKGARYQNSPDGLFLQIASYVPDEPTSTIEKNKDTATATIQAERAPTGRDYLDGDIFVLVKGNHVVLCPSGAREGTAIQYIRNILNQTGHRDISMTFELEKIAKTSKINMIREEGVSEILLQSSLYDASLKQLDAEHPKVLELPATVAQQLRQVFAKDPALKDISEAENLNVSLSIKFDGKEGRKKVHKNSQFGVIGHKRLYEVSADVLEQYEVDDSESFTIVTGAGNRITADEVRVSDSMQIETLGKSLSYDDAREKIRAYLDRLKLSGILEQ